MLKTDDMHASSTAPARVWQPGKWLFFFAVLLPLLHHACGPNYFFQEKKSIPNDQWAYRDTLDFRFTITDTAAVYSLYLDFEYADTFSTQNMYLKLYTAFPDGKRMSKVKSFDLFDAAGAPLGKCSGRTCQLHAVLQEKAYFNRPGQYVLTLEQYTRREALPGLKSVGLSIEPTAIRR